MSSELLYMGIGLAIGGISTYLFLSRQLKEVLTLRRNNEVMGQNYSELNAQLGVLRDRLSRTETADENNRKALKEKEDELLKLTAQLSTANTRLQGIAEQLEVCRKQTETLEKELNAKKQELEQSMFHAVELKNKNKYLEETLANQRKELDEIGNKFTKEFKLLANQILEDKSERFTKLNIENIDRLLKPLDENIRQFRKQVQEAYEKESRERFSLGEKVKELSELNRTISQEAKNLTEALKGQTKTQGNWGEMILESILSKSGLVKGREYTIQHSSTNPEGKRYQPDVIIHYPDGRQVVIDSKVSLIAYERYASAQTAEEQKNAGQELLNSLKKHIKSLSEKDYAELVDSLDFVMMFIPIEPAFIVAMELDPDIWNFAYDKRVLLISPTNLIAALKLIYDLWQREYRNRNAEEIAKRGGQLYDKFVGFIENFKLIGENIERARRSYDTAFNQLKEGRGNLIAQTQQLKALGAKAKKSIPDNLLPPDQE